MTGATRVLAAIDARMGEVYWAEYTSVTSRACGTAKRRRPCLSRKQALERAQRLQGEWAHVGTGWPAWPEMANGQP